MELHYNGPGIPLFKVEPDVIVVDFRDFTLTPAVQAIIPTVNYTTPIDEIPIVIVQPTKLVWWQ